MRYLFAALFLFLSAPVASAQTWSASSLDDLEAAAAAAPQQGLSAPEPLLENLLLARHISDLDPASAAGVDAAADDLFRFLADAYAQGAVDPGDVDPTWRITRPTPPNQAALAQALAAGTRPSVLLEALLPASNEYQALRTELARLDALPEPGEAEREHRAQVRVNLERWRWLPRVWPERRVEVRIAQFQLMFYRPGAPLLIHDVIVGARPTPSPSFAAVIESVTLNPDWNPPGNIVADELLPRFRRNPAAAAREGFVALDSAGVAIADVNWRERPFPYVVRQLPGPQNALGRLRFDLPNPLSVYLHDTPSKSLFARPSRAFSHGCIRVKDPLALAAVVLGVPEWDEPALETAIETNTTQSIALAAPTPVFVLYLTTKLDPDGGLAYLDDVYGRDEALVAALDRPMPAWRLAMAASPSSRRCSP